MEFFPDRAHVRLRSRVSGTYLHADEDGVGVSLRARRASLNTVWLVHMVLHGDGVTYVCLHSAAYGRYLSHSGGPAPRGHRGNGAIQRLYSTPEQDHVLWEAVRVGDHVLLRHASDCLLCDNGRYRRWYNGVSVDDGNNHQSTMMHWMVEAIPLRAAPPELPNPPPHPEEFQRIIVYVQADDLDYYHPNDRRMCRFNGRSVSNLRAALANHLREDNPLNITPCVRAGFQGRTTPLVVDLPRSQEPMFIIVLTTGSPAAMELRHPNVDAQ